MNLNSWCEPHELKHCLVNVWLYNPTASLSSALNDGFMGLEAPFSSGSVGERLRYPKWQCGCGSQWLLTIFIDFPRKNRRFGGVHLTIHLSTIFRNTQEGSKYTFESFFLGVLGGHILSQPSWKNQLSWQGPHAIPLWGSWTNHRYGLRPTLFTSQTTWVSLDIHSHNFHLSLSESIAQPE